ncbi:Involucrin repeat [Pyrenophora seminiperda CCB06]|uniref:Involucrin repeat n=1 Tax=Pyrenophora seminiperda CCB06 TaxID=1302712 RepID=A0A3M7MIZ0_9PLEO|nr:Involucrin repeat [Pyrenophora seminiperda CCB06]
MTERKRGESPPQLNLNVKRAAKSSPRSLKPSTWAPTAPKATTATPNVKKEEVRRYKNSFNDMLKHRNGGAVEASGDAAPLATSKEPMKEAGRVQPGELSQRVAHLESDLAAAKTEHEVLRKELEKERRYREADLVTIEELRQQLAEKGLEDHLLRQNHELRYRLMGLEEQLVSRGHVPHRTPERQKLEKEADDLSLRLHAAEKESSERLRQLLSLKSSISSLTRMESQVTDSDLTESFTQVANRVREWTVSNYRRARPSFDNLPKEVHFTLKTICPCYMSDIKNTDRLTLYQAIISDSLMQILGSPFIFGVPDTGPLAAIRPLAEQVQDSGSAYREWIRATIQALEHSAAHINIQREKEALLHRLCGDICHLLFNLTSTTITPNAQSALNSIFKDAVNLQRTLILQRARYQVLFFRNQDGAMAFDDCTMEAINDPNPSMEEDSDMDMGRTLKFCAFPGLVKYGDERGHHPEMRNILLKARKQNQRIEDILSTTQNEGEQIDAIAKIRGWFSPKEDSFYYPIIQDYLNDKIETDEAASKLFGPIDEKINAVKLDDVDFMDFWYSVIHSAKRLTFRMGDEVCSHAKLLDLLEAFKAHAIPNNETYNYLYQEMTDFDMACRSAYNDTPVPHSGFIHSEVAAWANMNFFYARVTQEKIRDLSFYAIFALRMALETPLADDAESTVAQQHDAHVPAAAAWISGCGHNLFRKEQDLSPSDPKQGNPARGGALWKGIPGFNKERWALWKERFAAVAEMQGIKESTRVVAKDAVEGMERSEAHELMR